MDLRLDQLPDDAAALKAMLVEQALKVQERDEKIAAHDKQIEARDDEIAGLKARNQTLQELNDRLDHHLRVLKRAQFGRRSEKLDPDQLALVLEDAEQAIGEIMQAQEALEPALREKRARRANLGALPASFPREEKVLEPESNACADCGCALHVIGEDVSERLDIVPQRMRVIHTRLSCPLITEPQILYFSTRMVRFWDGEEAFQRRRHIEFITADRVELSLRQ